MNDENRGAFERNTATEPAFAKPTPAPVLPEMPPHKTNRNHMYWAIPLALLLAAGIAFAGYYFGKSQKDDSQPAAIVKNDEVTTKDTAESTEEITKPSTLVDSYEGWQKFSELAIQGENYFDFMYPASWKFELPTAGVGCSIRFVSKDTDDSLMCIRTESRDGKTLQSSASLIGQGWINPTSKNLTIDDHPALQMEGEYKSSVPENRFYTRIDGVKLPTGYGESTGFLDIYGQYSGAPGGLDSYRESYRLIVDSIELK